MACDDNEAAARYRPTMADDPFSPDTLPLFPLGSVLFPGGLLPLQVFEVRYLDMTGRCHRAGQPFGVVALAQGHEVRRPGAADEQLHAVGSEQYDDCAWVSNRWCELLPLPATTRQQLMSLDNPLLRLELVADLLGKTGIGAPNS